METNKKIVIGLQRTIDTHHRQESKKVAVIVGRSRSPSFRKQLFTHDFSAISLTQLSSIVHLSALSPLIFQDLYALSFASYNFLSAVSAFITFDLNLSIR